jgi:hypothetical protein
VNETLDPAATETVVVPEPDPPPTLQRRFGSVRTVTGELSRRWRTKLVFVSCANRTSEIRTRNWADVLEEGSLRAVRCECLEYVMSLRDLSESRESNGGDCDALHNCWKVRDW